MNELALFAGAGGGILGAKLLGFRTVCAVERDAYAAAVLARRQNDGVLDIFPIWSDVSTFDGNPWRGIVDVISGGFPCTDISPAGKGAGIGGEKSGLWKQMARIVCEVRPRYVLVENSSMLIVRGLDVVLGDLAEMGYNAAWGIFSAADVGARHERERCWIVADNVDRFEHVDFVQSGDSLRKGPEAFWPEPTCELLGVPHGLAGRVDKRRRCIGNGQVPAVVRKAWHVLCQENGLKKNTMESLQTAGNT